LFGKKTRQLDEEALIEIERHRGIQDSRKFYKHLNVGQKRGTIDQQKASAGEMERTFLRTPERRLRMEEQTYKQQMVSTGEGTKVQARMP
jgi:2'-5' RNA ligase